MPPWPWPWVWTALTVVLVLPSENLSLPWLWPWPRFVLHVLGLGLEWAVLEPISDQKSILQTENDVIKTLGWRIIGERSSSEFPERSTLLFYISVFSIYRLFRILFSIYKRYMKTGNNVITTTLAWRNIGLSQEVTFLKDLPSVTVCVL